jgi:hypothetical protein
MPDDFALVRGRVLPLNGLMLKGFADGNFECKLYMFIKT